MIMSSNMYLGVVLSCDSQQFYLNFLILFNGVDLSADTVVLELLGIEDSFDDSTDRVECLIDLHLTVDVLPDDLSDNLHFILNFDSLLNCFTLLFKLWLVFVYLLGESVGKELIPPFQVMNVYVKLSVLVYDREL